MTWRIGIGLVVTLVSAGLLNVAYLLEHRAASSLPELSVRRPLRSLRLLLANRIWVGGFVTEMVAWGLYVLAVALAPLALVQAVSAGGIGLLAFLVTRLTGFALGRREWIGVTCAVVGLALLGISLVGGAGEGEPAEWFEVLLWIVVSAGVAVAAILFGSRVVQSGAAYGIATGIFFAAGDVSTKALVSGGKQIWFLAPMLAAYAAGTAVLQMGFQRGSALTTAGLATLLTNALPIAAGMTIFSEQLPDGIYAVLRVLAFAGVVVGAVTLARPERTKEELA